MGGHAVAAVADPILGLPVGLLIGVPGAVILGMLIDTARTGITPGDVLKVTGELSGLVLLFLGGKWLNQGLFNHADIESIRGWYLGTVTGAVLLLAGPRLVKWAFNVPGGGGA